MIILLLGVKQGSQKGVGWGWVIPGFAPTLLPPSRTPWNNNSHTHNGPNQPGRSGKSQGDGITKKGDVNNPQTMRDKGQASAPIGLQFPARAEGKSGMSIRALGCTKQTLAGWFKLFRIRNAPQKIHQSSCWDGWWCSGWSEIPTLKSKSSKRASAGIKRD